jgi:polygalacturonase
MTIHESARRKFLKNASMGVGGALLSSTNAPKIGAQTSGVAGPDSAGKTVYDVALFGAKGDGKTIDSPAIDRAIQAAAAAGGGTVYLRAGNYLCYSIHLASKVALYLDQGASIIAADPLPNQTSSNTTHGYDLAESNKPWEDYQDFGHNHWHNSLIWGEGLHDVSICGPGLIWGKGLSRGWGAGPVAEQPGVANKAIALKNCRNVLLRDFSILHGGHFGVLATGVDNLTVDDLKIDTNRDGIDVDCCRNVLISNCSVNSPWDDGICLKSSFALGYARATEMVTISNCQLSGSFEEGTLLDATWKRFPNNEDEKVSRTGRIKFGTESNGGFKNITVSNCVFDGCNGLAIESVDGAIIEDVTCTNITMRDLVGAPIFLRLGARMRGPANVPVGVIRRVTLSNITCMNAPLRRIGSILAGIPGHPIEDVKISDVTILHPGGGTSDDARLEPPEKEKDYPEPTMFGTTPSHGFFIRHVKGLEMNGIKIEHSDPDARPVFQLIDVEDAEFGRIKAPADTGVSTFALQNVKNFSVFRSKPVPDTELPEAEKREI